MWIFLPGGLLMPAEFPADKVADEFKSTDPEVTFDLQIRARVKSHLENFIRDYMDPEGYPYSSIQATPEMDYNFRFYCTRQDFAKAMGLAILEIDYQKFKPTAEDKYDDGTPMYKDGKEYHSVLNSIWSTLTRLGSPGGLWGTYSSTNPRGYKPGQPGPYASAVSAYTGRTYGSTRGYEDWDDDTLGSLVGTDRDIDWITDDVRDSDGLNGVLALDDLLDEQTRREIEAALDEDLAYSPLSDARKDFILDQVGDLPVEDWADWLDADEMEVVKDEYRLRLGQARKDERKRRRAKKSGKHRENRRVSMFRR